MALFHQLELAAPEGAVGRWKAPVLVHLVAGWALVPNISAFVFFGMDFFCGVWRRLSGKML